MMLNTDFEVFYDVTLDADAKVKEVSVKYQIITFILHPFLGYL